MRNKLVTKVLSLILVVVLMISAFPTIYATGTPHTISIGLKAFFEMGNDKKLTERTGTSHMSYVDDMRNSIEGSLAMEILGLIYGTGSEPDEAKYMEVLVNIMKTYERENAAAISEQHKMDNLKAIEDYGMDVLDIGVSLIPGMKGVDKSTEQLGDWIKVAISGLETMASNTTNWIEGISDLETIIQNYAKHDAFLALIETKSDGSLKKAASTLRTSLAEAMKIKLNSYSDISNDNFQNYTEFFFEDLFFDALKLTDLYDTDEAFKVFVDLGASVLKLWTAIKVGVEIGKFIGNIAVGSEDVINRVLEMKAVYDISEILEKELTAIKQNFDDVYSIETDKTAQTYITYGYYLISSRIRGEYCMYSMLAKDSGLYSHFGDETAKKAERVYNNLTLKLADVKKNLDMIPSVLVVNVGAEMPYEAVNTISEWNVYDAKGQLYDNYTLRVYDKQSLINFVRTGPVDEPDPTVTEYIVDSAEPLQITLEVGYAYTFEFVDNDNPDKIEYLTVGVTDSDANLITISDIETNFGDTYENLVTDAYSDAFTDDYDCEYCFHIPQFNLHRDLAQQVNQTIYDRCYGILERDVYSCMDEYGYAELSEMLYCWGYQGDLASVVIETNASMWADTQYMVYSISTATGSEVSMDKLLAIYGMDSEAFYSLVHNRLEQYWDEWQTSNNYPNDAFFEDRVTRTLADENIQKSVPFINPDGGLSFVANIYSLAGGDCYWHLINAEGALKTGYVECTKDHSKNNATPTGDALQYFIENCDLVYFTEADIQDFDLEMCLYARNAVFAKSGRKFQSQELQAYFEKYSWYVPCVEPDAFTNDMLNRKQLANVELIQKHEQKLKEAQELETLLGSLDGEEEVYTRYLHSGGYEELLGREVDENTLEVSSCLADFDNDGTDELFLSLGTGQSGVRGMETYTFLLNIESGKVTKAVEAYFGGGSMGGDYLGIRYDKEQLKHVLVLEGHIRDGVSAYGTYLDIYSESNFTVGTEIFEGYYSLYGDTYQESAAKVRSETSLYYEDGEDFRFYQINDQYVTKEAFDSAWTRFDEPREGFQPQIGSFIKPIA